MQNRSGEEKSA